MAACRGFVRTVWVLGSALLLFVVLSARPVQAAVGDVIHTITPDPGSVGNWCSIGLAFDGTFLHFDRCGDGLIHTISPVNGSSVGSFNPNISELPNALAYDEKRNGLWIGTQNGLGATGFTCGTVGMPIYFWDFDGCPRFNDPPIIFH